jgi:glucosylceramidase
MSEIKKLFLNRKVFEDERALKYVDGIAVHWYTDRWFPLPDALDTVHEEYPDKFILYTEACTGEISLD